jgi:hypothetical protein
MTIKQFRSRLDCLERSAKSNEVKREESKLPFEFPIDPAVVKAMWVEHEVIRDFFYLHPNGGPDTPEVSQARARLAELAEKIGCPPCYGFIEFWNDHDRLSRMIWDDDARAQIMARMEAFEQSPEGRARIRLDYLEKGPVFIGPAEYEELERLLKLYPEPWAQPKWSGYVSYLLKERGTPEDRKRRAEKDQRRIKERAERSLESKKKT